MAISKFDVHDIKDGGRLRIDHDTLGLRPPCKLIKIYSCN